MLKVRRVLISIWDKTGIVEFSQRLKKLRMEIISTGKTAQLLRKNGIEVKSVSEVTSFPEILSGRVKTLHPKIFGAILANKKHPLHMEEIRNLQIEPIDMVVVSFYPFSKMCKERLTFDEILEYIDIGGPSLLRAGAKNFKNVACVSSSHQYKRIIEELERNDGRLSENTLRELSCEAFRRTREYDTQIYNFLSNKGILMWDLEEIFKLRYGENPHQQAGLYKLVGEENLEFKKLQGKELSFNNLLDLNVVLSLLKEFKEPCSVIIKHSSPSGVGVDKELFKAYLKAYNADALSSFGGIIGVNRKVDGRTAQQIVKTGFKECIIAPGYSKEALRLLSSMKRFRVIEANFNKEEQGKDIRKTSFGYLIQDRDNLDISDKEDLKVVTQKKPTPQQLNNLIFAWKVAKFVKSNAIVIAKNMATLGIGGGQPSRVGAVKIAIEKSRKSTKGAVLASDGFFPHPDSIELIKKHQIKAIIQPGGSIKDKEIIRLCDKFNLSMVFTTIRHFRH